MCFVQMDGVMHAHHYHAIINYNKCQIIITQYHHLLDLIIVIFSVSWLTCQIWYIIVVVIVVIFIEKQSAATFFTGTGIHLCNNCKKNHHFIKLINFKFRIIHNILNSHTDIYRHRKHHKRTHDDIISIKSLCRLSEREKRNSNICCLDDQIDGDT